MSVTRRCAVLCAFVAFLLGGARQDAMAQNAATTGQIRGHVTDGAGKALTGASVLAHNTETGLDRGAVTGADGGYTIRLLPPGTYNVSAQMIGQRNAAQNNVRVTVGQSSTVNFQLTTEAVAVAGIEVSGARAPIDVTDANVTQTVSRQEIEQLPVVSRNFTDFIALSGVVAPDPSVTTGGQFSIAGQRGSQTNLQIDGVDANNSFFGENRGGSRIPFVFSLESIQEFQVITNGYDVEYSNYSGGIVNVVTRGGTNHFHADANVYFRSDALTGKSFLDTAAIGNYSVAQYAGQISGPIKKDKAFYFFSLDGQRRREPQVPITLSQYAPGGERENAAAFTDMQHFLDILQTTYGVTNAASTYAPFQTSNDVITLFGRLDWNINQKHRLSLRHNYAGYNNDNEFSPGFDFIYGGSRAEQLQDRSNSFVSELSSVLSANTFNVARFQFSYETRPRNGHELRPALVVRLSNGDQVGYGGTFVSFNNDLDERKFQLIDNFTHVIGKHTLKVGANGLFTHIHNQFLPGISAPCGVGSQGAGTWCFSDLNSFAAGTPSSYTFNVQSGGGMIPTADFNGVSWGVYAQDEMQVTPNLTLTAGLRHDEQAVLTKPARVLDVERAFGYQTGTAPVDNNNISPRLALAYDIQGNGRSVVRAGAGYFYSSVPYVLAGNVMSSENPVLNLTCNGSIAKNEPNAPPSPLDYGNLDPQGTDNPTSCGTGSASSLSGVPTYTVWNPDFEFPATFKANLGFEKLLGARTKFSLDGLLTRSTSLYTVRNLNLRPAQFTLDNEGGREIFTPISVFSPSSSANVTNSRVYSSLGNVFVNYNDGVARSYVVTSELNHRFGQNTQARISYTFTKAYDNSSYSCCEATAGFTNPVIGRYGPNDIGGFGNTDKAWGPSDFARDHTFILSGFTPVPLGFQVSAIWRIQSGRPFTPEVSGDLNGDGVNFNDRPFIFAPEDLPLPSNVADAAASRAQYAALLDAHPCIGDYVGQIIPRNTCRGPWTNSLDMRITRGFNTTHGQRAELQIGLYNVLNGVGRLFFSDDKFIQNPTGGTCGWGRRTTISGANQDLYVNPAFQNGRNVYLPAANFGKETVLGSNLELQFQAQIGLRYTF